MDRQRPLLLGGGQLAVDAEAVLRGFDARARGVVADLEAAPEKGDPSPVGPGVRTVPRLRRSGPPGAGPRQGGVPPGRRLGPGRRRSEAAQAHLRGGSGTPPGGRLHRRRPLPSGRLRGPRPGVAGVVRRRPRPGDRRRGRAAMGQSPRSAVGGRGVARGRRPGRQGPEAVPRHRETVQTTDGPSRFHGATAGTAPWGRWSVVSWPPMRRRSRWRWSPSVRPTTSPPRRGWCPASRARPSAWHGRDRRRGSTSAGWAASCSSTPSRSASPRPSRRGRRRRQRSSSEDSPTISSRC